MNICTINWGSVADWVSGLGSLSAVIVALYLSKESMRVRLQGSAGLRIILGNGMNPLDVMSFSVTNVGSRTTVVNNIGMRTGIFKKRFAIITVGQDTYSSKIPCQLADGEQASWNIPLGENKKWLQDLCSGFIKSPMDIRSLRFQMHTSNGGHIEVKAEPSLRKELHRILKEKKNGS